MSAAQAKISKCEVLMFLDLAKLNRTHAAALAGVSRMTFHRLMRHHRIAAPKPGQTLTPSVVRLMRSENDNGGTSLSELAAKAGVSKTAAWKAVSCETFCYVQ